MFVYLLNQTVIIMAKGERLVGYVKSDNSEKVQKLIENKKKTGYASYSKSRVINTALSFFFAHNPIDC